MTKHRLVPTAALLALAVGAVSPAMAQKIDIKGTVTLQDGSPVDGAEVSAVNSKEGRASSKIKTRDDGTFRLPFAEFGSYRFEVHKEGLLMFSMAITVKNERHQVEAEKSGEIGPDQNTPEYQIGPGRAVEIAFVMVPKDFFAKQLAVVGNAEATKWLQQANDLTAQQKYAESDELLKKIMEKDPQNANAWYLSGLNAAGTGRTDEATKDFEKTLELNPTQPGVNAQLGSFAFEKGDKAQAVELFKKELEISPTATPVAINLAMALEDLGRNDEAIAAFEKVIAMAPTESPAYLELANLYTKLNQQDKATDVLNRMEQVAKPKPAFWFNIGANYANADQLDKAEMAYRKALDLDPTFPEANLQMGYLSVQKGDAAGAVGFFEAYLKARPSASDAKDVQAIVNQIKKKIAGSR